METVTRGEKWGDGWLTSRHQTLVTWSHRERWTEKGTNSANTGEVF
jgi:hypothetical protein